MRTLFALVLFVIPTQLYALDYTVPSQKIEGADSFSYGDLVRVWVTPIKDKVPNLVATTYSWKVLSEDWVEKSFETADNGQRIFFGSGVQSKKYNVFLIITHLFAQKEGDRVTNVATKTVFIVKTIRIQGDAPRPPPEPEPQPDPEPDQPDLADGQFKLAQFVYKNAMQIKNATSRVKGAKALAGSFRSVSSAIAAGSLKSIEDALKMTKQANNTALKNIGVNAADWDAWDRAVGDRVFELYSTQKITSVADIDVAWRELASGLDKVR